METKSQVARDIARLILHGGFIMAVLLILWWLVVIFGADYLTDRNMRWGG